MKKLLLVCWLCCMAVPAAMAQSWQWARSGTCSSPLGGSEGWLTTTDQSGNVFMAGFYYGDSVCIGSTKFTNPVNPANNVQLVIAKYDSSGNLLWTRAGKHGSSRPIAITTDHKGNFYVFGYFVTDSIRFEDQLLRNPYYNAINPQKNACYFLLKYSDIGDLLWAVSNDDNLNPDGDYLKPGGIASDESGDIYIASTFNADTFRIGSNTLVNASADTTDDIFVAKYNTSGNLLWARSFGGTKNDYVLDVAGNGTKMFLTGYFTSGSITFDGYQLFNSSKKGFIASFGTTGNILWANSTGGKGVAKCAAPDHKGNVYVGGGFKDSLSFDTYDIYNANGGFFITRYDSTGTMHAPRIMNPAVPMTHCCAVAGLATDPCNNVWACVNMEVSKGIKVDGTTTVYPPAGSVDPVMLVGYNANDSLFDHTELISSGGYNTGLANSGLATDTRGAVMLAADFRAVDPFVIGPDTLHMYDGQQTNIFIAKYRPRTECVEGPPPVYPSVPRIIIYPDPARNDCILSYTGDLRAGGNMALHDITGKRVRNYTLTQQLTPFSVADLPAGVYMCMISVPGREMYTLRLVVVH